MASPLFMGAAAYVDPNTYDADALAYFNRLAAAGSLLPIPRKLAYSAFVAGLKTDGLWSSFTRIGVFDGGFAGAFVPLKGSGDDINHGFTGDDYGSTTGLTGDGTTKYIDTGVGIGTQSGSSCHIACYNATAWADLDPTAFLMGISNAGGTQVLLGRGGDTARTYFYGNSLIQSWGQPQNSSSNEVTGLIVGSRTGASTVACYRNGATHGSSAGSLTATPASFSGSDTFLVFGHRSGTSPGSATSMANASLRFYSIGAGLSAGQVTNFNSRVQTLMTALGRAV